MRTAYRLAPATLILVLLAAAGCARHEAAPSRAVAPAAVEVFPAGADPTAQGLTLPGRIKAREEVTLTARIAARLTRLPRREGERFAAREPLARFDSPETRQGRAAATAALAAAELRREVARRQVTRVESLFAQGLVSHREQELAQSERRGAEAEWTAASAAEAEWSAGTSIPAPFAGVVVRRHADEGTQVVPGQPLLDLRSDAIGEIELPVPESAIGALAGATLSFSSGEGPWRPARLLRLDGMTDYRTRTRTAHLVPLDPRGLEAGAFVRVRVAGAFRPAAGATAGAAAPLSVPASSLVRRGALSGVFVVQDGRAALRWLRVGRGDGDRVEVLAGLWPGESVVRAPGDLVDGQPVAAR